MSRADDGFEWVVKKQHYALGAAQRTAYEELSCENGEMRQQLIYAQIRENELSKALERCRAARADLEQCWDETIAQALGGCHLEDDPIAEQQRLLDQCSKKGSKPQKPQCRTKGLEEEEELYQQDLREWVPVTKEDALLDSEAPAKHPFQRTACDDYAYDDVAYAEPPPPYNFEQPIYESSTPRSIEEYARRSKKRSPSVSSPHVRIAKSDDLIRCKATPCCPSREKKKKKNNKTKYEVIGKWRKRHRNETGYVIRER
ncbi:hypothetical protein E8E14_009888 [Neopestalotiopsis sp. 37M]|nr:hypothetical protein E8E14_009888 [Neopestalotiopsis sp. 37M]